MSASSSSALHLRQARSTTALVFLLAELATVPLMARAIRSVANSKRIASNYHETFTLAAIAAVPLWLSSLVLFSGEIVVILAALALGVAGSVAPPTSTRSHPTPAT